MGTDRELHNTLWGVGVTEEEDRESLVQAIENLESAGDEFSNALYLWLKLGYEWELPTSKSRKEAIAREAKMSATELRKTLESITADAQRVLHFLDEVQL